MRITEDDLGSHGNQFVHPEKSTFEHLLKDQDGSLTLGRSHSNNTCQICRKTRPWTIIDFGDPTWNIGFHFPLLCFGNNQIIPIGFGSDTDLFKHVANHREMFHPGVFNRQFTFCNGGKTDE